jgi:hypothetical protein
MRGEQIDRCLNTSVGAISGISATRPFAASSEPRFNYVSNDTNVVLGAL